MKLSDIQQVFIEKELEYTTKRDLLDAKENELKKKLERLKIRISKHRNTSPSWTEVLLRPILNEIKLQLPDWTPDRDSLIPLGLRSYVSVFFYLKSEMLLEEETRKYIYITFVPADLKNGILKYDTGEKTGNFHTNSLGSMNGFDNVSKQLESIEEAVKHLQKQIDKLNLFV